MTDEPALHTTEPVEAPGPAPLPLLRAEAINAAPMLAQLAAHQDAWTAKFDDGDITAKEFRTGLTAIEERKDAIKWEKNKAELAHQMAESQRLNQWAGTVKDFMGTTGKQIGANRNANGSPGPLLIAFDEAVKKAHSDPANRGLSDKAILAKAHRTFTDDLHATFGQPEPSMGGADLASLNRLGPIELEDALLNMTAAERDAYLA
jgi:hypothetical protein